MSLARKTLTDFASLITGRVFLILALIAFAVGLPEIAVAAGGEAVDLKFTSEHMVYLWVSLAFGAIALAFGFGIRAKVMQQSKGSEKMQEVGTAIKDGALAYLKQQVTTMSYFVGAIAIGLFFMYVNDYGKSLSMFVSLSFIGGVAASYFAGYIGMLMAVEANVRTAHAALTSAKNSLETAFRSGSVAGMVTVGMGLIGATVIFMLAKEDAMKLLIGFGFGGSLAALFMRVGGGIFTKAADVGADLVGKVEAGIPEDDPRNPATIADNVGDNVGDCAGMAADIFESYEVTLVAAIILGAATAAIFDQETWMRLILFALMARGVGILASIAGIFMVKGSDDPEADPLKPISKGFQGSALIAAVLSIGLAWFMMGGGGKNVIQTTELISAEAGQLNEARTIIGIRDELAKDGGKEDFEITPQMVMDHEDFDALDIPDEQALTAVQNFLRFTLDDVPEQENLQGFSPVDFDDENSKIFGYSADLLPDEENPEAPLYVSFVDRYKDAPLKIFTITITQDPSGGTDPNAILDTQTTNFGPTDTEVKFREQLDSENDRADETVLSNNAALLAEPTDADGDGTPDAPFIEPTVKYEVVTEYPVKLYANEDGDLAAVVENEDGKLVLHRMQSAISYYEVDIDKMLSLYMDQQASLAVTMPPAMPIQTASVEHKEAEWWRFGVCILFGIAMAFVFERLTDYYVSLHKRPVLEVAGVATAGPAPMIITGFAFGLESSVFSVFAIVASLIAPVLIFPPADYGSYLLSFYGIALVGLGLLTTTGFILAMDTFGPISDNAQGVFEMSGAGKDNPKAARSVQLLDAAGNTTKALTKGFAIATAVVAAVALFHAYIEEGKLATVGMSLEIPEIFLGLLIGGAAPFLFCAFAINAVGRGAFELINEVRAQFRNDPGIMKGTSKPNYGKCVAIVTKSAQRELLGPGILAIAFPVLVAFGFAIGKDPTIVNGTAYNLVGAQALGGFLVGAILSGQLMAVMLANSGGIWDNAKKLIEDGMHGGKGTEAHKAGIVCDTVGDPFKDTAGPALNPLIKVMNLVALLLAPIVIVDRPDSQLIGITLVAAAALVVAIWWSKRSGMAEGLEAGKADAASAPSVTSSSDDE